MLGRLDSVLGSIDDDIDFVIYAPPDIVPAHPRQKGKAALGAILLRVQAEFEYLSYRPHVVGADANSAAVAILARLRRRSTGDNVDLFISNFVRFRNGRMIEMREFVDHADGVEKLFAGRNSSVK